MESYFINNVHIKKKETKDKKYQDYAVIKSTYLKNVDVMKTVLKEISLNGTVDDEMIMDMTNSITLHSQKMGYFIDCIHDLKSADEYTYNHSINVAIYAMLIGSWMKLPEIDIQYLVLAGILHDVGKSKIPK
jgi:HD-GYP domain